MTQNWAMVRSELAGLRGTFIATFCPVPSSEQSRAEQTNPTAVSITSQGLLTRHPNLSIEEFRTQYQRHALVAMPWALANGVKYYAQVRFPPIRQIVLQAC